MGSECTATSIKARYPNTKTALKAVLKNLYKHNEQECVASLVHMPTDMLHERNLEDPCKEGHCNKHRRETDNSFWSTQETAI